MKIEWIKGNTDARFYKADIGNYIRLDLMPRNNGKFYTLYLHIRKWKEDGCKEDKLCQAQEVASFKTDDIDIEMCIRDRCSDGRIRGLLQFYGANRTGRFAGRLVQVQNLPRNYLETLDLSLIHIL